MGKIMIKVDMGKVVDGLVEKAIGEIMDNPVHHYYVINNDEVAAAIREEVAKNRVASKLEPKSCPMCGSNAKLEHVVRFPVGASMVQCTNPECMVSSDALSAACEYSADERAIKAWNRRAYE